MSAYVVGQKVKHPNYKIPVIVTEIDGDMIAATVFPGNGRQGCHRAWFNIRSFGEAQ